ncbi:MAG: acylneuraminate cytidylyltransferase family protein [Myxococcota bacterium]
MSSRTASRALFLPCRRGSERVPDKNTRPFAGHDGGLLGLKLDQLEATAGLDVVIVDSNDPVVLERARARQRSWSGTAALEVRERPDALGRSDTTPDQLIAHALATIDADELAWTHVTSPFAGAATYARAFAAWDARARDSDPPDAVDSLVATLPIRSFVWSPSGPVNYAPSPALRWPRTQDLTPLHDLCSALFLVPMAVARARGDRLGERPLLFPLSKIEALDIDWEDDFRLAEALWPRSGAPR